MAFFTKLLPGLISPIMGAGKALVEGITQKKPIKEIFRDIGTTTLKTLPIVGEIARPLIEAKEQKRIEIPRIPSLQQPLHMLTPSALEQGIDMMKSYMPPAMLQSQMTPTPLTPPELPPEKPPTKHEEYKPVEVIPEAPEIHKKKRRVKLRRKKGLKIRRKRR